MQSIAPTERTVIVDHTSTGGVNVTHIRGLMLASSLSNLRELGVEEHYFQLLPSAYHVPMKTCVAASWEPIALAIVHYETCDRLELDDAQRRKLGEMMADRVAATFFGAFLRASRRLGIEAYIPALRHNDRLYDRLYQGGGVKIHQVGPKDITLENFGQPLVHSRHWRTATLAYFQAVGRMFNKAAYVRQVRPVTPGDSIAVHASWV